MKSIFLTLTLVLFVIPIGISQDLPSYVPTDGLLAYYPLDGNGEDKTDYQNHMNMIGQVTYTTDHEGKLGKAANFTNSINGYFVLPVNSWSHLNALSNGSLSFWIKLDQKFVSNHYFGFGNSFMVKQKHGQGQDFFIGLSDDTTKVMVYLSGVFPQSSSNYIVGNSSLDLDKWYNLTVTWNGPNQKLYVNGNLDGELNSGYDGVPDRTDIDFFSIGSATYGTNTSISESDAGAYGSMDNIAFWNRALTEQEIQNLYTSSTGDIILNGVVSAENNQIKNVNNPTDDQDVATKSYVDNNVNSFSGSYNDLTDTPTMYTQAQVDALISNLQSQIDGLTTPQGTAAINHNNKTYSGVSCEGFWLGFKFSVSDTQTITALGAWDEGHNIEVNDEFSSCPDASNFSVPIAIYKNDVLVLEKVINASNGVVIGNSRYIRIDDFVLIPGNEYFIIGNYEGSSKFGYFDSNLASSDYDSRITPLTVTSSSLFSKNTNGDGTFPSNLTTLSDNQWSDQYFHVNFLLKD